MELVMKGTDMTTLETIINNMDSMVKFLFLVTSLVLHRRCLKRYTSLSAMFTEEHKSKADCYICTKVKIFSFQFYFYADKILNLCKN